MQKRRYYIVNNDFSYLDAIYKDCTQWDKDYKNAIKFENYADALNISSYLNDRLSKDCNETFKVAEVTTDIKIVE